MLVPRFRLLILCACLTLWPAITRGQNLIVNGSFDIGYSGGSQYAFTNPLMSMSASANPSEIYGWTVSFGDVEVVDNNYWPASVGRYSVDLNGMGTGAISQAFATTIGATYRVSFDLAGNTSHGPIYQTRVSINATAQGDYTSTNTPASWTTHTFDFTATGTTTTLTFASLVSGSGGPALDNVSVTTVPEPAAITLGLGLGALGFAVRRGRPRHH